MDRAFLAKLTPEEMVSISDGPVLLPRLLFGKHAKERTCDIPESYFDWILRQKTPSGDYEFDENVVHTAQYELARRQGGRKP
jgi:uncharacterized protein (DUF3820 family)